MHILPFSQSRLASREGVEGLCSEMPVESDGCWYLLGVGRRL